MPIKLVITDLDGTMFDRDEVLPKFADEIAQELEKKGICFCFATGRSMLAARTWMERLNIATPCVLSNGAIIADKFSVIEKHEFKASIVMEQLCRADGEGLSVILSSFELGDDVPMSSTSFVKRSRERLGCYQVIRPPHDSEWDTLQLHKVTIIDDLKRVETVYHELKGIEQIACVYYGSGGMEIMPRSCNKAAAIKSLCLRLGIPLKQVLAIGNDKNDIEMLTMCGVGAAVSNACREAKDCADYRCTEALVYGVLEAIEKFC